MDDHISKKSGKSLKSNFRDEEVENYIVVPPDGGWGWVVVFASFLSNLIADGLIYTFGLFLDDISHAFDVSVGRVTMVGSIMTFFYYFVGPFVSALLNRFGFRCVCMIGGVLASGGYVLSSFCVTFSTFILCAGVVTGIGLGMVTIPAVLVVGYYFERWRALATGIATCGSGIGTLLVPILVTYLRDQIGWRNTYRILGCLMLGTVFLAICYRPLIPIRAVLDEKEIKVIQQIDSGTSFEEEKKTFCNCQCWRHHNRYYPTAADLVPVETVILENTLDPSEEISMYSYSTYTTNFTASATQNTIHDTIAETRSDIPLRRRCQKCRDLCRKLMCCERYHTMGRPMYRDDIFFGNSLMLLPQYKESIATQKSQTAKAKLLGTQQSVKGITKTRSTGYHMSVTRVTTMRELAKDERGKKCSCPLSVLRTLSTMLDLRLLRSPAFQILSWCGIFIVSGYMIPYLYIKDRAQQAGVDPYLATWLLSTIGAANTAGRIFSGMLPSIMNLRVIEYSVVWITIAGITTIVSGLSTRIEYQFGYACIYGFAGSCIATLRPIIVVELFGLEHLTNAFGLQMLFMAVAGFSGPMIAGLTLDASQSYNVPFCMSGACLITSAFLMLTTRYVRNYEKKYNCAGGL